MRLIELRFAVQFGQWRTKVPEHLKFPNVQCNLNSRSHNLLIHGVTVERLCWYPLAQRLQVVPVTPGLQTHCPDDWLQLLPRDPTGWQAHAEIRWTDAIDRLCNIISSHKLLQPFTPADPSVLFFGNLLRLWLFPHHIYLSDQSQFVPAIHSKSLATLFREIHTARDSCDTYRFAMSFNKSFQTNEKIGRMRASPMLQPSPNSNLSTSPQDFLINVLLEWALASITSFVSNWCGSEMITVALPTSATSQVNVVCC